MFIKKYYENLWDGNIRPFRIIGNVYFIGTYSVATYMIETTDGLVVINPGRIETLHVVIDSIYKLTYEPKNIKYIICTNWHKQYAESVKALQYMSGAKIIIGNKDAKNALKYFKADITVYDGDTMTFGSVRMEFKETPACTPGSISLFFSAYDNRRFYKLGMFGGSDTSTLKKDSMEYNDCRNAYLQSIDKLLHRKIDVMLGEHVWDSNLEENYKILKKTGENRFINEKLWTDFLRYCKTKIIQTISETDY